MRSEKSYYIYILRCADSSYYIGVTSHLEARLWGHEQGLVPGYTEQRRPVQLVYAEATNDVGGAIDREKQLKRWSRRKKEALIQNNEQELVRLAKHRFKRRYNWRRRMFMSR